MIKRAKRIRLRLIEILNNYSKLQELALLNHNRTKQLQERIARIEKLVLGAAIDYATNDEVDNYEGRERGEA